MLNLSDPLWKKLDDAHRDRDIPELLARLAETWDDDAANSLFWDRLCHQETCYGATYAAVPHLLGIANSATDISQRQEIAIFLGTVVRCAFDPHSDGHGDAAKTTLWGLPETLKEWDEKLEPFRKLAAIYENPEIANPQYAREVLLPRYRDLLATDAVNEADLDGIREIKFEFYRCLPKIRDLCKSVFEEILDDAHSPLYLLSGAAAADGLMDFARLLEGGFEGIFKCADCSASAEYMLFGEQVVFYMGTDTFGADQLQPTGQKDRLLQDYTDGSPTRNDGFLSPVARTHDAADKRVAELIRLADRAPNSKSSVLLRHLLGTFSCRKCGSERTIKSF